MEELEVIQEEQIKTEEEIVLDLIRQQEDYKEEKIYYGKELNFLINYIEESSELINRIVRTTYLYIEERGQGSELTIVK